ncbi:Ribosomal protein S18 [Macleaya cordata]|uniref:Small ribosomal subunit protein bS18c n=1 Tax=Macleaya cordata TaxID=56857 RepID=A0A200Q3A0_MACCD|nr:Ribosomal protein S18 [Macleaya cordata]
MNLIRVGVRSVNGSLSGPCRQPWMSRTLSSAGNSGNANNDNKISDPSESAGDFEQRIFNGFSDNSPNTDPFYQKLDRLDKSRGRSGLGPNMNGRNTSQFMDGLDESFDTLSDGMDGKLKKAATYFEYNPEEIKNEDYAFRPDVTFRPGTQYDVKDLDLKKPGVWKPFKKTEFEVTTEEVLKRADFRNGKFLENFITEAGIIIKRSKTRISAKAQRKVAREIKTARAFGLMPFTTMGQDPFKFGKSREDLGYEDDYDNYSSRAANYNANQRSM